MMDKYPPIMRWKHLSANGMVASCQRVVALGRRSPFISTDIMRNTPCEKVNLKSRHSIN